ncbi:Antibiotic biosynthesis monooxygenase [Kitasatospora sp. MMS16-BH015]|uniref:putative quinol monooxygenase n=1 Tax=Kitasatospora sp. MMS16-BH015 TaxID=2018025 RepID=UPI000CA1FC4D|nr:antibiotic biosynthesis monooxygenase [Kitasatospora sp. MMS16-BH015]AUG79102.1 Antibiotic biosynthesis monooxygenase [Kitasatospora sp. MMS16-BH015]
MSETILRTDDGATFMINCLDVEPEKQKELAEVMSEGAEKYIRHRPGCLSVNVLTSNDGKRVLYIAQWRSKADIKATLSDPNVQAVRDRASELAKPDAHAYTVYALHHPDPETPETPETSETPETPVV